MPWEASAARLADRVTRRATPWRAAVADVPRHLLVPAWWAYADEAWSRIDGPADPDVWLSAAYADKTLVTRVGPLHADLATEGQTPGDDRPTSSSTLPSLLLSMYGHADLHDGVTVVDVGTGAGYGTALLSKRLGDGNVTSVDVDPYLTAAAAERLSTIGLHPEVVTLDATGPLPGTYDRIIATVSVRPIPMSWLEALRPGGRMVTVISGTTLLLTADKDDHGGAVGRIEWDRAGFMRTRHGDDYPADPKVATDIEGAGDDVSVSPHPIIDVAEAWDVSSMLDLAAPGIRHRHHQADDGTRTAYMWHEDGSWARAVSRPEGGAVVHQSGPQRLWDHLDDVRRYWLEHGELPVRGAKAIVRPDGRILLSRGDWKAVIR